MQSRDNLLTYTPQGKNNPHLVWVCACVCHSILPSVFADHRGHGCLSRTTNVLTSPPGEAAARQRRTVRLGPHGLQTSSALTGADRRLPWMAREFGARRFLSSVQSETIPQLGTIWPEVEWSRFRPSRLGRVLSGAQPEHPIRVTTPLRVVTPAHTTGSIKGRVAGLSVIFPAQRSSPADSAFFTASSLAPPTRFDSAFLHPLVLTPPSSTHWLLTPPKVLPSRLSATPVFLDQCLAARSSSKQETTRQLSGRYRPAEHPLKTYWWRSRSIVQGIERPLASSALLFLLIKYSSSGSVCVRACVRVCVCVCMSWRLSSFKFRVCKNYIRITLLCVCFCKLLVYCHTFHFSCYPCYRQQ